MGKKQKSQSKDTQLIRRKKSASITFLSRGSRFSCFSFDSVRVCNDLSVIVHTMGIFYAANINCRQKASWNQRSEW